MRAQRDTLPARFFANASRLGTRLAHHYLIGDEQYPVGWSTMARVVRDLAAGLIEVGHQPGDRVAVVCGPRRESLYWDLAIQSAGGVSVMVHPGLSGPATAAVLDDAEARFCIVDTEQRLEDIEHGRRPALERVIVIDESRLDADGESVMGQGDLRRRTPRAAHAVLTERLAQLAAADAATFAYSARESGPPHGAMFSHGAVVAAIDALAAIGLTEDDSGFSYLPAACAPQRLLDYLCVSQALPWCHAGAGYLDDAERCEPTVMVIDSGALEEAFAAVYEYATHMPVPAERMLVWARAVGRAVARHRRESTSIPGRLNVQMEMMRRILFERVAGPWGRRLRVVLCQGDPPATEVLEFFAAVGLPLVEVWGPAEAQGVATLNLPQHRRVGSVGNAAPGVTLAVGRGDELVIDGDVLFSGYYKRGLDTAAVFDERGAFRSGVLAGVDGDGYVTLRGAQRDIIVTSSGLAVSPEPIERLLTADPRIRQAVVVGHGRASLTALVRLSDTCRGDASDAQLHGLVQAIIARRNLELPRAEQLTGIRLLPYELTTASGELDATQHVRRRVVVERFAYLIDEMY